MPEHDIDLLAIDRSTVTAPAGSGKTHLIADALTRHGGGKPVLVLTHTNAGVVALRGRLDRAGVPAKAYRLSTIDGWAMRLISTFPARSAHNADLLQLAHPRTDYPNIRVAAAKLLKAGHLTDILAASYARLIVDEYQNCSIRQHAVVAYAAQKCLQALAKEELRKDFLRKLSFLRISCDSGATMSLVRNNADIRIWSARSQPRVSVRRQQAQ